MSLVKPPTFDPGFCAQLDELFLWRRDVRRFRPDPLPEGLAEELVRIAGTAPSVGYSQPWRFVRVDDPGRRARIRASFERANGEALAGYAGERAATYAGLKLSGLDRTPLQLAVLCDAGTERGNRLGRRTMPETLEHSVVLAVHTLWLAARARGIGVGWVSIIDPCEVHAILSVPAGWKLVAYLCLGWPEEEHLDPELVRHGWEEADERAQEILQR